MKARLVPVYFKNERTERFSGQLESLRCKLDNAEILEEVALGDDLPDCEAVLFPEILGEAYRSVENIRKIDKPILIITSEFATISMWDWEIGNFLRGKNIATIAPYSLTEARQMCQILAVKRKLASSRFLIFQDNPGEGFQPEIFKSFYWWEKECTESIENRFGVSIERRSLKKLGEKAAAVTEEKALKVWKSWDYPVENGFQEVRGMEAARLYLAVCDEIDGDDIIGIGTNCLNESHFCRTTPCLAWDRLLEEKGIIWACEGDTSSLITKYLLNKSFNAPLFMTNIYPFLMGDAALKHEKIPSFPEIVDDPENHILLGHCGYFGLLPRKFSTSFTVRRKKLAIVNENSHMLDSRMKTGNVTVTKFDASFKTLMSLQGNLKGYVQYDESSDVRNGGILRVPDGRKLMENVYSHHVIILEGNHSNDIRMLARLWGFEVEEF